MQSEVATQVVELTAFDPNALTQVVSGAELEHKRLPGGDSAVSLMQSNLPHSVFNRGVYSGAILGNGTFPTNAITIGMYARQTEQSILNGSRIPTGTLVCYPEKADVCYRGFPGVTWFTFTIARERLLAFCADSLDEIPVLPNSRLATFQPKQKAADQFLSSLRDLDRSLCSLGSTPNAARLGQAIENDILGRIATLFSSKPVLRKNHDRRNLRLRNEILRKTMKLVEDDPSEMLDLASISRATGLSPRTLQRVFRSEYGLCPQEWLRVERLNRVRQELLDNSHCNSVTEIAIRWGFFHLGRFSNYYRELFGELPTETLSRRVTPVRPNRNSQREAQEPQ
jgi:AraC-like DNA-binding protein